MNRSGTNLLKVRDYNMAVVLDLIRKHGPISRREISVRSGLSFQTVSNISQTLIDSGVTKEGTELLGDGVRQARALQLCPNAAYAIGIHLDRAKLSIVLTNFEAKVVWRSQIPSGTNWNTGLVFPLIEQAINRAVSETKISKELILGIGLGLPGPLDVAAGCLLAVPNLSNWANHSIREELSNLLGLPVFLDEDVTAIILGEQWCRLDTESHNFVYLYLGPGIGLGIVVNGHALRGWKGNIGQIGHIQVDPTGPICHCGKFGCLEAYATPMGILREARVAAMRSDKLEISGAPALPEDVGDVVKGDNPIFQAVVKDAATKVGLVLSSAVAILDPELVLVGGETMEMVGDDFIDEIVRQLSTSVMPTKPLPRVRRSSLGIDVGAIGAATLVLHDAYAPSQSMLNLA
jgi:predicted NBD/HSP70 family sugar kinase